MRNFTKGLILSLFILANGIAIAIAAEDTGLTVVPGIDFGFKHSTQYIVMNGSPLPYTNNPNYITLIPSLSISYGKLYGAISLDTPITESHTTYNSQSPQSFYSDRAYLRQETLLTLGYRLIPALSIFTGYMNGETKVRQVDYNYDVPSTTWKPDPREINFTGTGYFAGLSTNYNFEGKGTIALSAAYANLQGSQTSISGLQGETTVKSQNASGYSTSLSWSGPMSESVFYQIGYRYAKYTYNFSNLTIEEPVRGWTFGLRKYF